MTIRWRRPAGRPALLLALLLVPLTVWGLLAWPGGDQGRGAAAKSATPPPASATAAPSGAADPPAALVLCGAPRADRVMVNGRSTVETGMIPGLDLADLMRRHSEAARKLQG